MNKYAGNTNCIKTMEISGSGALLFIYKLLALTKLKQFSSNSKTININQQKHQKLSTKSLNK